MANDMFGKFKSTVNRGITTISVKTSSSLEKTKIKTHIDSLKREVEKGYSSVGEAAYKIWANGEEGYAALNEQFAIIKQKLDEIDALTEELNSIDDRDNRILGTAESEFETESKEEAIVCPSCKTKYDEPVKFCRNCGKRLQ